MTRQSHRIHDRIRQILETTPGLTQRGLAARMGLNPAAINRMLYGRRNIMAEEIPVIENYLGQKLDIHLRAAVATEYRQTVKSRAGARRGLSDVAQQPAPVAPFSVPAGSFAVYVFSNDMAPRYFKGELVQVDPGQPATEGRDCLIEKKDGTILLRRLLRRLTDKVRVQQFSPCGEKDIPLRDIKAIYPVIARS